MNIWLCNPSYNPAGRHTECNREWVESFRDAFIELGFQSEVVGDDHDLSVPTLVFGAQLLNATPLPDNHIIFQLEQIEEGSPWLNETYIGHLRCNKVWDYSRQNIAALKRIVGTDAQFCELGFSPSLQRLPVAEEDVDIFFAGSLNERRQTLLQSMENSGLKIAFLPPGTYGAARDQLMARAKIVLNVHYYKSKIFEIFRCAYAMANVKCIVSEKGPDTAMEMVYADAIEFCDYENMLEVCKRLIADDTRRNDLAWRGYDVFSSRKQSKIIAPLVGVDAPKIAVA